MPNIYAMAALVMRGVDLHVRIFMTREEDIAYDFLENDRIWPPLFASDRGHPFAQALVEVLTRLPDEAYDVVAKKVSFVVEDYQVTAVNVPFNRAYPPNREVFRVSFDTIVIFHPALAYSHAALVGLLAHELAHSLVSKPDYKTDEEATDALVLRWGFGRERKALTAEQQIVSTGYVVQK